MTYGSGYFTDAVTIADVNGDGKPDILVANCGTGVNCRPKGVVGVLLGNGNGTFQGMVTYGSGSYEATSVAVADVNGDGNLDIVVANKCGDANCSTNGNVGVLLGNSDGTFQTAVTYGSGAYGAASVAIADVNGDGKPDILVANECDGYSNCNTSGLVGVLLGKGDGTFQAVKTHSSGGYIADSLAASDVNGDGKPDVVVANRCVSYQGCGDGYPVVGVLINTSLTATTTKLVSSPNPSNYGQAVTFTAAVKAQQGFYKGTPTGTVSFFNGKTNIGHSKVNGSGVAKLTTSALAVGTHSIKAVYNGDANCAPSTSPLVSQVVKGDVELSPMSVNFGNQTVGTKSLPKTITLTNKSSRAVSISDISIVGTDPKDFAETNTCGESVPAGASCSIKVTFKPLAKGKRTADVSISDSGGGSPQKVSLTGTGT